MGSTKNGRDSNSKRLGVKVYVGQPGSHFHAGPGVGMGKDYTLFATKPGTVEFYTRCRRDRQYVSVVDREECPEDSTPTEQARAAEAAGETLTRRQEHLIQYADVPRPGQAAEEVAVAR